MQRPPTQAEMNLIFQAIGQGLWYLQFLEDILNKYLTLKLDLQVPGRVGEVEAFAALEKRNRSTLGAALKAARESGMLDASLESRLAAFTDERNWLVHKSLDTSGESFYTAEGQALFIERVARFVQEARDLQKKVGDEISNFARDQGVNLGEVERRARSHVAKLRGDA
jgi:hypothetical protein